jgi:acetylornithine deacetylase
MGRRFAADGPFDHDYDVPHNTVHTGLIAGGTALNIVPAECRFDFEFRYLPGTDPLALLAEVQDYAKRELLPRMQGIDKATGFDWEGISAFPGLDIALDEPVVQLAKALTGANATGKVAFGTEAGLFQQAGIPTVICGPGSIAQAHKPDEYVALDQIAQCEAFLRRLIDRVAA